MLLRIALATEWLSFSARGCTDIFSIAGHDYQRDIEYRADYGGQGRITTETAEDTYI